MRKAVTVTLQTKRQLKDIQLPSDLDLNCFFESISKAKIKPAILRIMPPYCKEFIPTLSFVMYPKPNRELYNPVAFELMYHDILTECVKTINSTKVSLM